MAAKQRRQQQQYKLLLNNCVLEIKADELRMMAIDSIITWHSPFLLLSEKIEAFLFFPVMPKTDNMNLVALAQEGPMWP